MWLRHVFSQWESELCLIAMCLSVPISQISGQNDEVIRLDALKVQQTRDSIRFAKRNAWLATQGKLETARTIRARFTAAYLRATYPKYANGNDLDRRWIEKWSEFLAQDIASTYTLDDIASLKTRGIDILSAVGRGGSLADFIATSDFVVIAEVTAVDTEAEANDGFLSTVTLKVIEVFKGPSNVRTIQVRELTGKAKSGIVTDAPGDMVVDAVTHRVPPAIGTRFGLLLSKNLYPLRVLAEDKSPLKDGNTYYVRVGPVYHVHEDGRLVATSPSSGTETILTFRKLTAPYR